MSNGITSNSNNTTLTDLSIGLFLASLGLNMIKFEKMKLGRLEIDS
jgi:hypothetical protein